VKLSLSEISTLNASFEQDVEAYAAAGFGGIGLWEMKLPADDEANLSLIRRHGLSVTNCVPTVPSFLQLAIPGMEGPVEPDDRAEAICGSIRRLAAYDPECVLCLSGPLGERSAEEGRSIVRDGLRRAASAAREAGVRLGFEPIHPAQQDTAGFVCTLADALTLVEEAGLADEVGIMADTFNLAREEPQDVARIAARLTGVHVADVPLVEAPGVRVLPGEGKGRSAELVASLRRAGWDGWLDVEIFSTPDAFWSLPVDQAASRAYTAAAALTGLTASATVDS
jgi:sugar phosphate isomerase/epimerase